MNTWFLTFERCFETTCNIRQVEIDWIPYIRRQVIIISYIGFVRQINVEMKARIVICDTWKMMDLLVDLARCPNLCTFRFPAAPAHKRIGKKWITSQNPPCM